ncbi:virulence-associated E family protein [[Leptolyngbya] sp. PCC 7376]|nr:virulence-associated E family protein [[Leptolyngbya] sp. PCC 7376]
MPDGGDIADWVIAKRETIDHAVFFENINRAIAKAFENQIYKEKSKTAQEIVKQNDPEAVVQIEAKTTKPLTKHHPETRTIYGGRKDLNYAQLYEFIQENLASRLSFDLMRRELLIDGEAFHMADELRPWFFSEFGETAKEGDIYKTIVYFAKQNNFDPVLEDLERCHREVKKIPIDNLAARYFGQDPDRFHNDLDKQKASMYNRCIELWLISAVARQYETAGRDGDPHFRGCQADHTLVLQGGQGKGKSTWFGTLCGGYFNESMGDIQANDSKMALHSNWILELAEIDGITSKKAAATLKHFLTIRVDEFRTPYARKNKPHARRSVFCGTVNPSRFLVDDENRRFWVIPVISDAIDIEAIAKERDGIWASAVEAYKNGEKWYPTLEEKKVLRLIADDFAEIDPWQEPIESYLQIHDFVNTREILLTVCKLELKDIAKRDEMRVSKILTRLGWTEEKRVRKNGQSIRVRYQPKSEQLQMEIESDIDTNIISPLSKKVGNNGKSSILQGSQLYQPSDQPAERSVRTNLENPLLEVGTSETIVPQAIQPKCTNLTDNLPVPKHYLNKGFKYGVGQKVIRGSTSEVFTISGFPPPGVQFMRKEYLCVDDHGDSEWIQQKDLFPYNC